MAILSVAHDFAVVSDIATDVAVMQHRNLIEIGTKGQVLEHPHSRRANCLPPCRVLDARRPCAAQRAYVQLFARTVRSRDVARFAVADYSFAHASVDDQIAFQVRAVPNGCVSPAIARTAHPVLTGEIDGSYGEGYMREDHAGSILAVASGSGLTQILCILERAVKMVEVAMHQPIPVSFGAGDVIDVYGIEHLTRLPSAQVARVHRQKFFRFEEAKGYFRQPGHVVQLNTTFNYPQGVGVSIIRYIEYSGRLWCWTA